MGIGSIGGALASGALGIAGYPNAAKLAGAAGTGIDLFTRKKPKVASSGNNLPDIAAPPADRTNFANVRPSSPPSGPGFIQGAGGLNPGMTDIQRRSNIASQATQGEASAYRDPATLDYYRNLAIHSMTDPSGAVRTDSIVLPIERQYLTEILGEQPRDESVASFLSALLRSS